MKFEVEGPFELNRTKKGLINTDATTRRYYWEWVDENVSGLSEACGCYIFAIQASRGTLPWYVGKAEKQPFRKECFSPHKINHFNNAIAGRKGKPVLFFIPQVTNNNKYRNPTTTKRLAIQELESLLMGMALSRNPNLLNAQGTKWIQQLTVKGFLNSNKAKGGPAAALREMLDK
ncbi:MAG: hypothetical protein KZQ97_22020 [Candidatus Thiodiazotropha sp. (ex Dulcina madagascariensis)]|nr:hypothetical protein [Candidatus Thiodiazotropha sp. (ex Dulcina madagascariensis)]